ncbi:MAG: hypothetical protein IT306_03955 [Chloroflexi bacterium]|nr:hypothetical protein [Chloroflexota bacterium]
MRATISLLLLLTLALPAVSPPPALAEPAEAPGAPVNPLRAWYFAEGNSRNGFETYFTLRNLADEPAAVTALYSRDDGIRLTQWIGIEPRARLSLNANDIVGARAFGATFLADQDIVVERTTIWGPGQNGETTVGFAPDGGQRWYFAEGTTRGRATTYFVTQNLTDLPAVVTAAFMRDDGKPAQRQFWLAPRARDAFRVNDLLPDAAFSASFTADQDIVVERTIMTEGERPPTARRSREDKGPNVQTNGQTDDNFAMARNATGIYGGLGYLGSSAEPGLRTWEFAEGSTRAPYSTNFVLFNPGQQPTTVRLIFRLEPGGVREHTVQAPAQSRVAVDPRDIVPAADFATTILADRPIVAERAYLSSGDGVYGALGHTVRTASKDARDWYFAEGNTTSQIQQYFVLFNLSERDTQVRGTYYVEGAGTREQTLTLPAGQRLAVRANDTVGEGVFAARFSADQNVVVERTAYLPGGSGYTTLGSGAGRP